MMLTCQYCRAPQVHDRFCCANAELVTLRAAIDRALTSLESEITAPLAIADADSTMRGVVAHATVELQRARARAARPRAA